MNYRPKYNHSYRIFTLQNVVYDVSSQNTLYGKGGAFNRLAGKDASRALARNQMDETDSRISGLSLAELESLREWAHHFEEKYPRVGILLEDESALPDRVPSE